MKTNIFHLQIIPLKDIIPQESFDNSRSKNLAERIKKDNKLSNPMIVAPLTKNKYIQLDGMNRYSAFKRLKLNSIICQIVDYQDIDNVELASWLHLLKIEKNQIMEKLIQDKQITVRKGNLSEVKNRYVQSEGTDRICTLVSHDFQVYIVSANGKLLDKINILNRIVSYYSEDIVRDVLPQEPSREDIGFLFKEHFACKLMLIFPTFSRHQITKVVKRGGLFPTGITRHVIKRRCLNLNFPLDIFREKSVEVQNMILDEVLMKRKFRLYEEPTIYFE